jgi:RimJ/RimL family protein N-acetyltransferase
MEISKDNLRIEGERLYLRPVTLNDATETYVSWLNDEEIKQRLDSHYPVQTLDSVKDYIQKNSQDPKSLFLAIVLKDGDRHIGNIKLGPIDWHNKFSDLGIMIGDKDSWGKGYATEAERIISDYALDVLKLHKIICGSHADNPASLKAILRAGFHIEGIRKNQYLSKDGKNGYVDVILIAKFAKDE